MLPISLLFNPFPKFTMTRLADYEYDRMAKDFLLDRTNTSFFFYCEILIILTGPTHFFFTSHGPRTGVFHIGLDGPVKIVTVKPLHLWDINCDGYIQKVSRTKNKM